MLRNVFPASFRPERNRTFPFGKACIRRMFQHRERPETYAVLFFNAEKGGPDVFSTVGMSAFLRSAFGSRGLPRCPVRRAARSITFLSFLNFVSRVLDPLQTRAHMIVCCRMTGFSGTALSASGGGFDVRRLRRSLRPSCRKLRAGRFAGSGSRDRQEGAVSGRGSRRSQPSPGRKASGGAALFRTALS